MRWKFTHHTVEDLTPNTLHRSGCDEGQARQAGSGIDFPIFL
jgi:hypothetical protein